MLMSQKCGLVILSLSRVHLIHFLSKYVGEVSFECDCLMKGK